MKSVPREVTLASLKRPVVVHQLSMKRQKMTRLPSKAEIASCKLAAARRIPELLELMASKPTNATRFLFYGYITLHWSCFHGHRPGVYANLTDQEVIEGRHQGDEQQGHLIHIKNHKTAGSFGEAQLYLEAGEFAWMERWLEVKKGLKGKNHFFIYTINQCLFI
ncbi:hypothetical protein CesoFtcFv8_027880 [Champsocephalus esox]|uniref:Uncharacterized protein n=1 Tax=Champsocephalus esox TaxID=159716 RepID=A0AAN8AZ95_9TELE|nr:hypothetical protein CesoFtcFv8_027880 [Champsocephalus esox]